LEIKDNGNGFDLKQTHQSLHDRQGDRGLGLTSMRERAERVGGRLVVNSVKGEGTRIFATLPLQVASVSDVVSQKLNKSR
jgi:signal transduction histidine kinase